jgi:hypothetical protein
MASDLTTGVFFYLRVLDEKPLALFRLDVDTDRKEINETVWDGSSWQETDRLTMYIGYGSTEVEQVLERDATLAFPDAFRDKAPNFKRIIPSVMSKHLAGKHDQASHGAGHGHTGDLAQIAGKIKEKTSSIEADGGSIFQASGSGIDEDEAQENLELAKEGVQMVVGLDSKLKSDRGIQMTNDALGDEGDMDGDVHVVVEGKTGTVAGAMRLDSEPVGGFDENPKFDNPLDAYVEIPNMTHIAFLGTTGTADGAGSALFGRAVQHAAKRKEGLALEPLDKDARSFWRSMGFADNIKIGGRQIAMDAALVMSPEAVQDLAQAIE